MARFLCFVFDQFTCIEKVWEYVSGGDGNDMHHNNTNSYFDILFALSYVLNVYKILFSKYNTLLHMLTFKLYVDLIKFNMCKLSICLIFIVCFACEQNNCYHRHCVCSWEYNHTFGSWTITCLQS